MGYARVVGSSKWVPRPELPALAAQLRAAGRRIAFTNGCFDLLHPGHVRLLAAARAAADVLVVGINDDASVSRLKGPGRPVLALAERAEVLGALAAVDFVTSFHEDTPAALIAELVPDVLVKGGDWTLETVVGRQTVEQHGGRVLLVDYVAGWSTSELLRRIRHRPPDV